MDDKNIGKIREEAIHDDQIKRSIDKMGADEALLISSAVVWNEGPHDKVVTWDGQGACLGTLICREGQGIHIARRLIPTNVESGEPR